MERCRALWSAMQAYGDLWSAIQSYIDQSRSMEVYMVCYAGLWRHMEGYSGLCRPIEVHGGVWRTRQAVLRAVLVLDSASSVCRKYVAFRMAAMLNVPTRGVKTIDFYYKIRYFPRLNVFFLLDRKFFFTLSIYTT